SEGMALAADVGMQLWYGITGWGNGETSHWLLFERGYNYGDVGQVVTREANGESELHPIHVTSWGEGDRPVIESLVQSWQKPNENFVISDITMTGGFRILSTGENFLLDGIKFDNAGLNIQGATGFTLRNAEILDNVVNNPTFTEDGLWAAHSSRVAGIYMDRTTGSLFEGNLFLHNGWEEGYDGTDQAGMPPSMFSQNAYFQSDNSDLTFRDNITAQAASYGAQFRSGGFIENNLFLDNNAALNLLGGDYVGAGPVGEYSLFMNNIITSAAYKDALSMIGAKYWGLRDEARDSTLLGNIVAHMADPNNPDEIAFKTENTNDPNALVKLYTPFFDDTIVFNWNGYEANLDGLDPAALNQITIQNFAMEFLGLDPSTAPASEDMGLYYKSGLIYALMDYARENWGDGSLTAQDIIDWFQAGFGFDLQASGASHHRFVPNDLGDGVRWDNKLNWTSDALPSDGDTVDLGGNWVNFSDTVTIAGLDLGTGGKLQVGSGKLTVDALETGDNGMIFVERAGQFWTDGYGGDTLLSLQVTGGRFANTGDVSGPVIASVQGGQMILATDDAQFSLGANSELRIDGTAAKVGFDGATDGIATLMMQDGGQLSFVADATGLGRVTEFRSGAWDQEGSAVHSGIALNGTLALDLSDYIGTGSMTLIAVDAIAGMFDNIDIHGLGDNRDAALVIDYAADLVTLELSAGSGQGSLSIIGDASYGGDEDAALWDALTSGLDQGADLDAPITIFDDMIDPLADMHFI
ncbi:right-handed parallel beta-helix repeat-containing protein, partial [Yoonia sp.]|uniref:right-handed parallel beta-helix repeat-containing protein n=1 Tax=Yoonia sp. TaxID=2212373 RepID=UPI0019E38DF8